MSSIRSSGRILVVVASLLPVGAQTFVKEYVGDLDVSILQTAVSADGGSFAAVRLYAPNGSETLIAKLFPSGEAEWQHRIDVPGSPDYSVENVSLLATPGGGVAASFWVYNSNKFVIVRLDRIGNLVHQASYRALSALTTLRLLAQTRNGTLIVGSNYSRDGSDWPHPWLGAVGPDDQLLWAREYRMGLQLPGGASMTSTLDGGVVVSFANWLLSVDQAGDVQWQRTLDMATVLQNSVIAQAADGSLYLSGAVSTGGSAPDPLVAKLTSDGTPIWGRVIGDPAVYASGSHQVHAITATLDGGVAIAGQSYEIRGGLSQPADARMIRLLPNGATRFDLLIGGANAASLTSVGVTDDDGLLTSGGIGGATIFDASHGLLLRTDPSGIVTLTCRAGRFTHSPSTPISITTHTDPVEVADVPLALDTYQAGISQRSFTTLAKCVGGPSEVSPSHANFPLRFASTQQLKWEPLFASNSSNFSIFRSDLPGTIGSAGACLASGLVDPGYVDTTLPISGRGLSYIVAGRNGQGRGTLGYGSNGLERSASSECP